MIDFPRIIISRMMQGTVSRNELAKALQGTLTKAALYSFLDGKSGVNSRTLGVILEMLEIEVKPRPPRRRENHELSPDELSVLAKKLMATYWGQYETALVMLWEIGKTLSDLRARLGSEWPEYAASYWAALEDRDKGNFEGALMLYDKVPRPHEVSKYRNVPNAMKALGLTSAGGKYFRKARR